MDWYPHHIGDYDHDTQHLTVAEDGAYSRMLRWYYRNEAPLLDDDVALAGICRVGLVEWQAMAPKLRRFFVTRMSRVTGVAHLFHKRCNEVISAQNKKRKDGKSRQEKLRKNGVLEPVTRHERVSNAPRVEETQSRGDSESDTPTEIKTTAVPVDRGVQGAAPAAPAAPRRAAKSPKPKTVRTRLPPEWEPTERNRQYALSAGLTDPQLDAIAIRYRRYWTGQDARNPVKADWARTWENWIDREIADGALSRGNGGTRSTGYGNSAKGWAASLAEQHFEGGPDIDVPGRTRGQNPVPPVRTPGARPKPGPIPGPDPGETVIDADVDARSGPPPRED